MSDFPCDNCGGKFNAYRFGCQVDTQSEDNQYAFCSEECRDKFAEQHGFEWIEDEKRFVIKGIRYPETNEIYDRHFYDCDNCGKTYDMQKEGIEVDTKEDYDRVYGFCSESCISEFQQKYNIGYDINEHRFFHMNDEINNEYCAKENDVLTPDSEELKKTEIVESTDKKDQTSTVEAETPTPDIYDKKASECWKKAVETAREIDKIAHQIIEEQEVLKDLKRQYESLVKRQNDFILQNGDSIQLSFFDCEEVQKTETPEKTESIDMMGWRDERCNVLNGFTYKQMEKIESVFHNLGEVQTWACKDFRDKKDGIGQKLEEKLIEAMDDYAQNWYERFKESGAELLQETKQESELEEEEQQENPKDDSE